MIKEKEQLHFFFRKRFVQNICKHLRDFQTVSSKTKDKIFIKWNIQLNNIEKDVYWTN